MTRRLADPGRLGRHCVHDVLMNETGSIVRFTRRCVYQCKRGEVREAGEEADFGFLRLTTQSGAGCGVRGGRPGTLLATYAHARVYSFRPGHGL